MKRIGLMGCGSVAHFGHGPALTKSPDFRLWSVVDPVFESAVSFQKEFGAEHAFHDQNLFFNSGPEALVVCSPAPTHRDNVFSAARRRLPVLCEKPLAMSDEEAEEMIQVMAAAESPLMVGFCYRFSPVAQTISRLVREGAIGEVRSLRLIYIWNLHGTTEVGPDGVPVYSPRRAERMLEGGPLVDCGVHQIDLARWWLQSEVEEWSCEGAWVEDYEAPDHVHLHMNHANGVHTFVETSFTYSHTAKDPISHFTYQLIGTEGVIRYDREAGVFEVRRRDGTDVLPWSYEKNFEGMYSAWARAMRTDNWEGIPSGTDGLIATRIARQATESVIARRAARLRQNKSIAIQNLKTGT